MLLPALIRRFHEAQQAAARVSPAGAAANPCGKFCTWMIWPIGAVLAWSAGSRRSPRPDPDSLQFLNVGTAWICRSGSCRLVAEAVGYEGEILWDTKQARWHPEKQLDVSKLAPSAGRPAFPWPKPAPRTAQPIPSGLPPTGIRSPLNLAPWPSIEGLISAIQVARKWTATRDGLFLSSS